MTYGRGVTDRPSRAGAAVAAFRRLTTAEPDGVWSAPGRVNLIGEHTELQRRFGAARDCRPRAHGRRPPAR
ncbi:MAG TPA: galactokinase family protein [Candidatus Dormibacteraeota bacterium]